MLLILVSVVGILIGVGCLVIYNEVRASGDFFENIGYVFTIFFGFILGILLIVLACNVLCEIGSTPKMEQTYESLIYKAECGEMRDEFGIVNKQYVDEIQAWNEKISSGQGFKNNKWTNWLTIIDYEDFETIDLNDFKY